MNLLTNFLLTIGIIITLIILLILGRKKEKGLPHYILISIFTLLLCVAFYSYGELNGIKFIYSTTYIFADSIGFLLGPLFYLYIKSIYQKSGEVFPRSLWHFIPGFIYVLFVSIPFIVSILKDDYLFSYIAYLDQNEFLLQLQVLYLLTYVFLSLWLLKKFQTIAKENFSNLNNKDLVWIKYFLYGIITIMGVHICIEVYSLTYNGRWSFDNTTTTVAMIGVVLYLGYYGTGQSRILLPNYMLDSVSKPSKKKSIHHLSNTPASEIIDLENRLKEVLTDLKPYEDELLSLEMLAEMIPTTDRKLSALLNHKMNVTFYDLINSYRVEAVKKKMAQKELDKYTLLALAYDGGFNSKTSFNRIFKKHTGLSPSAYKKQL